MIKQNHQPTAWTVLLVLAAFAISVPADFSGSHQMTPFEEPAINYAKRQTDGPIDRLQRQIASGEVQLKFDPEFGYLPALLEALKIPRSSQMLVFSKTSLQRFHIRPKNPRAIFFNEQAYIGWIPTAPVIEVTSVDPKMGGIFYTLEQTETVKPKFVRTDQCIECHASSRTLGVPGHTIRSFVTDDEGNVDFFSPKSVVNHRTPFEDRWGGWYVSGTHGQQHHRGNLIGKEAFERQEKQPNLHGNVTDLSRFFRPSRYLEPHSDIVALLVFEHQAHMHNLITRLNYEAMIHLSQYRHVNYLTDIVDAFLKYLLFVEEAPLTDAVKGTSDFTKWFEQQGPRDPQGRSFRQFDLQTRLFKYPCSPLIYSEAFDGLEAPIKAMVYRRLWEVLSGKETRPEFEKLTPELRQAIREILVATKPGLPDYWME